jgi:hypothetical protein
MEVLKKISEKWLSPKFSEIALCFIFGLPGPFFKNGFKYL